MSSLQIFWPATIFLLLTRRVWTDGPPPVIHPGGSPGVCWRVTDLTTSAGEAAEIATGAQIPVGTKGVLRREWGVVNDGHALTRDAPSQ